MSEVYKITNITDMASGLRQHCFDKEDLGTPREDVGYDGYVTVPQVEQMILGLADKEEGSLYITDAAISEVYEMIRLRVLTTALARIAGSDMIEVGYKDDAFIFWVKGAEHAIRTVA